MDIPSISINGGFLRRRSTMTKAWRKKTPETIQNPSESSQLFSRIDVATKTVELSGLKRSSNQIIRLYGAVKMKNFDITPQK